jgi:hypothetical protein
MKIVPIVFSLFFSFSVLASKCETKSFGDKLKKEVKLLKNCIVRGVKVYLIGEQGKDINSLVIFKVFDLKKDKQIFSEVLGAKFATVNVDGVEKKFGISDINGDGHEEFYVSVYSQEKNLIIYTLNPNGMEYLGNIHFAKNDKEKLDAPSMLVVHPSAKIFIKNNKVDVKFYNGESARYSYKDYVYTRD